VVEFTETQQSGHDPRSEPEIKNGRSSAEDGAEGLPGRSYPSVWVALDYRINVKGEIVYMEVRKRQVLGDST